MRAVNDDTDFDQVVLRAQGTGASGLKVYADVTPAQIEQIVAAARRHGMPVWSHAYHRAAAPSAVADAGVNVMSHAAYLAAEVVDDFYRLHRGGQPLTREELDASLQAEPYTDLFSGLAKQGTLLDTTLSVFELRRAPGQTLSAPELLHRYSVQMTRWANERGVPLVAGTDLASDSAGLPFPAVHYELQLLVEEAGLTPLQALQAATINAARALALEDELGSVAVGKVANLVVLDADPAAAIVNTRTVAHVIKNGRFSYRGDDPRLPFSSARPGGGMLWLSGQIGNFPGTMTLAGPSTQGQMHQAMRNIGQVLEDYGLTHDDILKCTLMLANIDEWGAVNEVYTQYFNPPLPARSAFAASGLALGAGVEIECVAPWAGGSLPAPP
jgi:reactive intermediate/imine deaminase